MLKVIFGILVILFVVFAVLGLCSGCATRPVVVATDESIIAGQVSTARIEAINGSLREILQFYDGTITEQSGRAIRGIDDALAALDRYDEFVQYCISRIRELERATRSGEGEGANP